MLDLHMRATKQVIARAEGSVYCEISVSPRPQREGAGQRGPVALVLCLDRSGSMAAPVGRMMRGREVPTKMAYAHAAAERMIALLRDGDSVGLVSFSTVAAVEIDLTPVSPATRDWLVQRIRRIEPDATTNIADGLATSRTLLTDTALPKTTPRKIVLLSDGLANVGVSDADGLASIADGIFANGITVSSIGVGQDYSLAVMSGIAQAGRGEFYHVSDPAQIEAIVAAEVAAIGAITARAVELSIRVPDLVALGTNLNLLPQEEIAGGARIRAGDLVGPRRVVFEVALPLAVPFDSLPVRVECVYRDGATDALETTGCHLELTVVSAEAFAAAPCDAGLAEQVVRLIGGGAVRQATVFYEQGQVQEAEGILDEVRLRMCLVAGKARAADMDRELADLKASMSSHELTIMGAKTVYGCSFAEAKSRPGKA